MTYGTVNADLIQSSVSGVSLGAGNASAFKNRIINGAMVISQYNGSSAFGTSINGYCIDRWQILQSVTGKLNGGQNYNSATPPAGFANYLGFQSQSAYSIGSSDYYTLFQPIEGYNTADLAWGTASAKTVTLSFQVYSSLTGTFGGNIKNASANRNYPFTYTISSANTWTSISVTIPGDTSGTWGTTNGVGIYVFFGLGVGSTFSGTAGSWQAGNFLSATGATSVVGTNGATFYITGVQLEVGSVASGFDYRPYTTELALCQRYFYMLANGNGLAFASACYFSSTQARAYILFPTTMRSTPALSSSTGTDYYTFTVNNGTDNLNSFTIYQPQINGAIIYNPSEASGTGGMAGTFTTNNASAYIGFSAEL